MLIIRESIPILNLTAPMVNVLIAEFDRERPVGKTKCIQRKLLVLKVLVGGVERILPVVAGVVENDVEEDAHIAFVGRRDQVDKVLLCPEAWIDVHVVLNRVAMIVPGSGRGSAIVLENR